LIGDGRERKRERDSCSHWARREEVRYGRYSVRIKEVGIHSRDREVNPRVTGGRVRVEDDERTKRTEMS
jgi:hypothetical protein